jgi:ketosteroid isomerase-like protein
MLIESWPVHSAVMSGVLADHSDDIVMFDVPPPHEGVRGIDAYRETWPPFFEWQAQGASFEIVSLDVTVVMTSATRTPCCAAEPAGTRRES